MPTSLRLQGIHVILLAISVVCTFHKLTHIISSVICWKSNAHNPG
jgi:hypothetical protein